MAAYPIRVESVSRFKSAKEQKETLAATAEGKVDILIGTHRLLSKDVEFKKLCIVIVDEEHRFGVEHKEKLKTMKLNTHVLTLSATPNSPDSSHGTFRNPRNQSHHHAAD